jgi:hypothetical protein
VILRADINTADGMIYTSQVPSYTLLLSPKFTPANSAPVAQVRLMGGNSMTIVNLNGLEGIKFNHPSAGDYQ